MLTQNPGGKDLPRRSGKPPGAMKSPSRPSGCPSTRAPPGKSPFPPWPPQTPVASLQATPLFPLTLPQPQQTPPLTLLSLTRNISYAPDEIPPRPVGPTVKPIVLPRLKPFEVAHPSPSPSLAVWASLEQQGFDFVDPARRGRQPSSATRRGRRRRSRSRSRSRSPLRSANQAGGGRA